MRSTLSSAGSRRCTTGNKDPPPRKLALVPCLHRDKVVPLDGATNPTPPPLLVSVSVFISASLQVWLHVWLHVHAAFMKWVYKKIDMHVNANGGACFVKTVTPFLQGTVLEPHISLSGHALVTSPRLDISPSSRSPLGYEHLANDTRMSPTGQCKAENSVWRPQFNRARAMQWQQRPPFSWKPLACITTAESMFPRNTLFSSIAPACTLASSDGTLVNHKSTDRS